MYRHRFSLACVAPRGMKQTECHRSRPSIYRAVPPPIRTGLVPSARFLRDARRPVLAEIATVAARPEPYPSLIEGACAVPRDMLHVGESAFHPPSDCSSTTGRKRNGASPRPPPRPVLPTDGRGQEAARRRARGIRPHGSWNSVRARGHVVGDGHEDLVAPRGISFGNRDTTRICARRSRRIARCAPHTSSAKA